MTDRKQPSERDNIQVSIRIKPMFEEGKTCIRIDPNLKNTIIIEGQNQQEQKFFSFDNVAGQEAEQEDIFEMIGEQQATNCIEGYNGCVFVYGQTGSGKTYTMTGTAQSPGLLPRVIDYLFKCVFDDQMKDNSVEYLVKCSHLEIYNEHIIDLLNPDLGNLQLREDLNKGVYVEFLTEECCANLVEAMEVLQRGNENRHISSTQMNFESSRSHSVFTIQLESRRQSHSLTNHRFSRFHFVDLAGSERQKHTQVQGDRLREGCQINRSLHILGNVINSLVEDKEQSRYVHYRDSKLTFLLKDSLGGNSRTHLIATIQQSNLFYQETLSTLMFSKRVKQVKNKARVNEDESGSLESLKNEIKRLKQELAKWIVGLQSTTKSAESPDKKNIMMHNLNFDDLTANDQRYIKLEEILKVYLEQSTESETALYVEIEKYLSGIKELREAFQLSSQLEQQLKLIIRLQNEQIIRLKHANGCEDLSSDYDSELAKALLSQAAVMKKFSDSLRLKEGSAKTVEKAKLQINENVQLLNTIVATVNSSLEERRKFQKQIEQQFTQVYVPIEEFNQLASEQTNMKQQLTQAQEREQLIKQSLDQIGITIDEKEEFKIIDHKQRDLSLEQLSEQLEVKSRAVESLNLQLSDTKAIVTESKEQNIQLTQSLEQVQQQLQESQAKLQETEQQLSTKISEQIEQLIQENDSLKQQNQQQELLLQQQLVDHDNLMKSFEETKKQNKNLTAQVSEFQQEQQALLSQIEELKKMYQQSIENFQSQEQQLQDQISKQKNKENDVQQIQDQLKKQIQTIVEAHEKEISNMKTEFQNLLSDQQQNYEHQIQEITSQITENHQHQIQEQKLQLQNDHFNNMEELKNQLKQNYQQQLEAEKQQIQNKNEQKIEQLQNALQIQLQQLEQQLNLTSSEQQQQTKARLDLQKEVHQLQQQIIKVQESSGIDKRILEEKCEAFEEKINEYEMTIEEKNYEIEQVAEELKEQQNQEITKIQAEFESKLAEYENAIQEKEAEIEELQIQINQLDIECIQTKQELQQIGQRANSQEQELKKVYEQVTQLKKENDLKYEELKNKDQIIQQHIQEVNKKSQELEDLTIKYNKKSEEMDNKLEEVQLVVEQKQKEVEYFELQKIPEQTLQELQGQLDQKEYELQMQNEDFMKQQNILFDMITNKDNELNKLQEELNDYTERLREASNVIEQYSTCNSELKSNIDHLHQQIEKQQQIIHELQGKAKEQHVSTQVYEEKVKSLNEILKSKQNEVDNLQVLLSEGSQNENEIQFQNQQMSLKLQLAEKKLQDLENEYQELQSQFSNAQEENETTIEQLESKIRQKDKEKAQLNQTLKDLQDQIMVSNSNVEEQKIWVMHYKKEVSKLTKEVTLQQQIHQQHLKENDNIKGELNHLSKKYDQIQQQNQQLRREIEQQQQHSKELSQLKTQFENQIQQYEEQEIEMRQIQQEKLILQTKTNELNKALTEQQHHHQETIKQLNQQQEELQNVKKELQDAKQKNKVLQQQYQNDLENLNLQIQVVQEELESSKINQQEVKKHEQEQKELNVQMRANLERLKVDNTQRKNEIQSLQNELEYNKQEIQIKEDNIFKLQEQLKYKQQQLDSQATMMNQVEQNKLNQTNQILQQSNQLTNLSKEIFSLKQQLQINETQTESYKREVERLRRELEFHVKQSEDYKSQNKKITSQLDFEKKNQTKQRVFDAAELLSKIDSTLSPIKGSKGQLLYGSSDSKTQKRVFQQKTPSKEYGFQNSSSSSMLNTSFQSQDQLAKENRKLKANLEQKIKIIEQLEEAVIQSEQTLKDVHEKANEFCQQQEEEIRQIKDQYQKLEQEHNAILAEREYENQQINQQKQQALFKVQILQDEVLKSKRGSVGSQHISGTKYAETVQDMSLREPPSSSHRYRQSEGSFKSYFGAEAHSLLIYDTQKLLLENQKLNGYMCKLYQILGLDKNRSNKLNDGDKIIQSVQLLLQEIIDCKQEIQNLIQAQPSRSLKYQSMEKELMETKQKYYAVERSPKFWNPRSDTPKAKFFNYSNSTGK